MTLQMRKVQPNAFVTVAYCIRDEQGEVIDSSDVDGGKPIDYVHGYGMLVPGLEAALTGLEAGDERKFVVPPEEAYGPRDPELVLEVDRAELPDPKRVQPGDELVAEAPDGEGLPMRVLEVRAETVVVDANHPLAGMTLHYEVKVLIVRSATGREIERAARELADAEEHEHGPDCDHDLVSLGTNKRQLN